MMAGGYDITGPQRSSAESPCARPGREGSWQTWARAAPETTPAPDAIIWPGTDLGERVARAGRGCSLLPSYRVVMSGSRQPMGLLAPASTHMMYASSVSYT